LHLSLGEFSVDGARLVDEACPVGKNHSVSRARPIDGARVDVSKNYQESDPFLLDR